MNDELLDSLIGRIYDGVLDPESLEAVIESIVRMLDADSALLVSLNRRPEHGGLFLPFRLNLSKMQIYLEDDQLIDPWRARVPERFRQAVKVMFGEELVPSDELEQTPFYQKVLFPEIHHMMTTLMRLDSERRDLDVAFAVYRPRHRPHFDESARSAVSRLAGHLRRALLLAATLEQARYRSSTLEAVLDRMGQGALVCDGNGHIAIGTSASMELVVAKNGLSVVEGCLTAVEARNASRLRGLFSRAAPPRGVAPSAGRLALRRQGTEKPLLISVFPIPSSDSPFKVFTGAKVLVIIHHRDEPVTPHWDLFAGYYNLTTSELKLLRALGSGLDLGQHAEQSGISRNTARSHLQSIFVKTGARRQSELVKLAFAFAT